MPPAIRNEREMAAVAKAIAEAITPDIDALSRIIAAKLQGLETSNEPAVKVSTIEEKIEQSVSTAVKAAMADVVHRPFIDVTALRDGTVGSLPHSPMFRAGLLTEYTANIEFLYDLMVEPDDQNPRRYSAPKLVTAVISVPGGQHFSASVLRLEHDIDRGTLPGVTIEVCRCKSNIEALQKLYEFSQDVVSNARSLSHDHTMNVRYDFWEDLECIHWGEDRSMGIGWV
jgi:hypothetical protein